MEHRIREENGFLANQAMLPGSVVVAKNERFPVPRWCEIIDARRLDFPERFAIKSNPEHPQIEEVQAALKCLVKLMQTKKQSPPDFNEPDTQVPDNIVLAEREFDIMKILFKDTAFDGHHRMNTPEIFDRLPGKDSLNAANLKDPVRRLKQKGLITTIPGRGGGCFLTAKGRKYMQDLQGK